MTPHKVLMLNADGHMNRNAGFNAITLTTAIIGISAYIFLFIPIVSLIVVGSLNLSQDYILPVAVAWIFVGIYLIDNYVFSNFMIN